MSMPEKRLLDILARTQTAVVTFDASGRCAFCSPLLEQLLNLTPGSPKQLAEALSEGDDARHHMLNTFESVRAGEHVPKAEIHREDESGRMRIYTVEAISIESDGDRELAVIVQDVSSEISLRRDMEQIGRLAALGQVTAGVAHEINNILTSVLGWSQIAVQNVEPDSVVSSAIEIIEGNAKRAQDIASHLLGVSRPVETENGPFSIIETIEDVLKMLSWEMRRAKIEVVQTFETNEQCLGNGDRVGQVFINIIRNAMDAMPDGGTIRIGVRSHGDQLVASFSDSGPGMESSVLEQIFDPFFTTKSNGEEQNTHGGTGLGLALCRDILQQQGGRIEVESSPGKGTRFSVLMPLTDFEPVQESERPPKRSSVPPGVTILVVDDEPDIGEMIRTALELQGVSVHAVQSGEEAAEICLERRFDVAFIDYTMPGLSGHRLGHRLIEIQPDLPIIFMSGRDVEMKADLPVVDFIKKPFGLEDIQAKLTEVVGVE
jgi:signal transduction histidine kinase